MARAFPNHVDWEDLRHFAAFVEGRSLTAAAARLGVDHVTVARRLAALEESLGVKLVDRRARVPVLTPGGERIAALVRRMEEDAFGVARTARGLEPSIGGDVSVSAPPTLVNALIAPRLPELRSKHPEIHVRLSGEKRVASLAKREADIAIRLVRPTEPGLVARKIGSFEFHLYGAASYLAGRGPKQYEFIAFDEESRTLPQQRWLLEFAGDRPIVLRTNDLESQLAAARAGLGVAALPDYLAARHEELVRLKMHGAPVERGVWLVVHDDLRSAPAVRAVMDFLVGALAELGDAARSKPGPPRERRRGRS